MSRIVVLGAGSWGTTIAKVIADGGSDVTLWARRAQQSEQINLEKQNPDYLPGILLPANISATSDIDKALEGVEQVYIAIPSQQLRQSLEEWSALIPKDATLISLMKGLESGSGKRMSEVIAEATG